MTWNALPLKKIEDWLKKRNYDPGKGRKLNYHLQSRWIYE